jgi:hypothetical protein
VPFTLIDHENLARAEVLNDGFLAIGGQKYRVVVLPAAVDLPPAGGEILKQFSHSGGLVLRDGVADGNRSCDKLVATIHPATKIQPASPRIALGRFTRDGRQVLAVVNVGTQTYHGQLSVGPSGDWLVLDPATGTIDHATWNDDGTIVIALDARQTRLFVGPPKVGKSSSP